MCGVFHTPSILVVEVKVNEPSHVGNYIGICETHMPPEVGLNVQNVDISLISVSDPFSPPQMEEDSLPLSNCVSVSSRLEPRQLSVEDSSSDRVGYVLQDTAVRPRNLRSKGIMAF